MKKQIAGTSSGTTHNKRKYTLANPMYKNTVDLTKFKDKIIEKIHEIVPDAIVIVEEDGYILDCNIGRGQIIKIGRNVATINELWEYRYPRDLLFVGHKIEE